jgi:cysteinyl-tRNA synthetase
MSELNLYNSLSRSKEKFTPINDDQVGLYTCGPTVYNYAHLGNLRTYVFEDLLKRVLVYNGYKVKHVMNITDVGHLTGDMDMGEDKLELGARREGKSAWEIAEFYTQAFKKDITALNIIEPDVWCKATDHINEQVALVSALEEKGFTYRTSDGIYFDTSKVAEYNKLSHLPLNELKEGARVEKNAEKKNATDFALWKFSAVALDKSENSQRQMEWDSPWGVGFPGWHLECSAMSLKYLTGSLDNHCGGIDHINIHHSNEIAQSEAATGVKFFNYWLHGAFLNIAGGKKMAKSDDNFLTLERALIEKGIKPLVYRYACLAVHYRKPMEYSEEVMTGASNSLEHLYHQVSDLGLAQSVVNEELKSKFMAAVNDDLNLPQALAIVQEVLKAELSPSEKLATVLDFDRVLGLGLDKLVVVPQTVVQLADNRRQAKLDKDWARADEMRAQIEEAGYMIKDLPGDNYSLLAK